MRRVIPIVAAILGLGAVANGLFMLVDPANWYFIIPGVTNTGPFNQHFIRDIGMIYGFVGVCFIVGAWLEERRALLWILGTVWLAAHALFHIWEVTAGICGPRQLLIDFPDVILPPLIGGAMSAWAHAKWHRPAPI